MSRPLAAKLYNPADHFYLFSKPNPGMEWNKDPIGLPASPRYLQTLSIFSIQKQ
jgi:hypothetical protein